MQEPVLAVQGEGKSSEMWSSRRSPTRACRRHHPAFEPEGTQPRGCGVVWEAGAGSSRAVNASGSWLLSLLMGGCRKGGRRCWGGVGWLGVSFHKWPRSVPALSLITAGRSLQSRRLFCPSDKAPDRGGGAGLRGTGRGALGGVICRQITGYLSAKQGHVPAGCMGGGSRHLRGDAHGCPEEERLRAVMAKDGAGSSSNGVMTFSPGGSVLAEIPARQLLRWSNL